MFVGHLTATNLEQDIVIGRNLLMEFTTRFWCHKAGICKADSHLVFDNPNFVAEGVEEVLLKRVPVL